ncbi:MAG: hypothetical protein IPJ94_15035 [Chloroflexi bacterium]|nr:hypothetical protein [Chloroflexota bacterium]
MTTTNFTLTLWLETPSQASWRKFILGTISDKDRSLLAGSHRFHRRAHTQEYPTDSKQAKRGTESKTTKKELEQEDSS